MGLMARLKHRWYVWSWRVRFFWLDTREGEYLSLSLCGLGAVIAIAKLAQMYVIASTPAPPGQPQKAIYAWVYQLIVMLISAAVSYAMRPRPQAPTPTKGEAPVTDDGQAVVHHFGECWIDDEFILAWKQMGTEAIKAKGGK